MIDPDLQPPRFPQDRTVFPFDIIISPSSTMTTLRCFPLLLNLDYVELLAENFGELFNTKNYASLIYNIHSMTRCNLLVSGKNTLTDLNVCLVLTRCIFL